jgi:hypothetical protein
MANRRTTFGKLQRERDKKEKALIKAERRAARLEDKGEERAEPATATGDQDALLEALADLHRRFEDGGISIDDFEERRDQLTSRLRVD